MTVAPKHGRDSGAVKAPGYASLFKILVWIKKALPRSIDASVIVKEGQYLSCSIISSPTKSVLINGICGYCSDRGDRECRDTKDTKGIAFATQLSEGLLYETIT